MKQSNKNTKKKQLTFFNFSYKSEDLVYKPV